MKILNKIYHFFTKTRLRKILSSILVVLILLTTFRFLLIKPREALADSQFKFDELYGTSANDQQGNVTAGMVGSTAQWRTPDFCIDGPCLYFSGLAQYVGF